MDGAGTQSVSLLSLIHILLWHVLTKKGKGLEAAVRNPEKFHGATPYDIVTGESTSNSDKSVTSFGSFWARFRRVLPIASW